MRFHAELKFVRAADKVLSLDSSFRISHFFEKVSEADEWKCANLALYRVTGCTPVYYNVYDGYKSQFFNGIKVPTCIIHETFKE